MSKPILEKRWSPVDIQNQLRDLYPNCEVYVNQTDEDKEEIKINLDLYIKIGDLK